MTEKQVNRPTSTATANHDDPTIKLMLQQRRRDGLERELCCMMFEWESFPKLMEEKSRIYNEEAQYLAQINEKMALELERRGIVVVPPLPNWSTPGTHTGDHETSTQMLMDASTS